MWLIQEHRDVDKELSKSVPLDILKRYEKWKDIAALSGPQGLRAIKGFRDEALTGKWKGYRSSRLNEQWRVVYKIVADAFLVQVIRVTPHDYRRL
jgi:toxin HigB-1